MHYLSICAILKNEAPYLKEWVEFHLKQGVEHFYLCDNESDDADPKEVLAEFKDKITWAWTAGRCKQGAWYNQFIKDFGHETKWAAFIDVDEFLYSSLPSGSFSNALTNNYDLGDISGIAVHWLLFGSSGHLEYSPEPVLKRFTMRAEEVNNHVKSVMKIENTLSMGMDPHTFYVLEGSVVDELWRVLPKDYATEPGSANLLRINHYHTKSKAEALKRRQLPDANSGIVKDPMEQFLAHDKNEVEDKRIWHRM